MPALGPIVRFMLSVPLLAVLACGDEPAKDDTAETAPPPDHSPQVTLDPPATDGLSYDVPVTLSGTVQDIDGLDDIDKLSWSSDRDGVLGDEASAPLDAAGVTTLAVTLSPGDHLITLQATDQARLSGADSLTLTVAGPPAAPSIEITAPSYFDQTVQTMVLDLAAQATDADDAAETLAYTWTWEPADGGVITEIDSGLVGNDGAIASTWTVDSDPGDIALTLTVTDPAGNSAQDLVHVLVIHRDEYSWDGDHYGRMDGDCDDSDPEVHPYHAEWCDGKDNDCDGIIDDKDDDEDGHIDAACTDYDGALPVDDCDDTNDDVVTDCP